MVLDWRSVEDPPLGAAQIVQDGAVALSFAPRPVIHAQQREAKPELASESATFRRRSSEALAASFVQKRFLTLRKPS